MIEIASPADLRRALECLARRDALPPDVACAVLGLRPIAGGALPVTLTKTQVASTDSPANAPTVWNTNVFQALEDLFGIPDALAVGRALFRSVLAGCQLSNDGTTPNSVIDVSAGIAMSSDNLLLMDIGAFTGSTGGIWVSGSGSNKMDTSTAVAANTWYHVYLIGGGGNATDILFSTNAANAPTLPTGYSKQRRIGAFKTATATTNILAFVQDGDYFEWAASVLDFNGVPGVTTAVLRALTVPLGVNVFALYHIRVAQAVAPMNALITDPAVTDETPGADNATGLGAGTESRSGLWMTRTNTSSQVRTRVDQTDGTLAIRTRGWIDRRGRDL